MRTAQICTGAVIGAGVMGAGIGARNRCVIVSQTTGKCHDRLHTSN